MTDNPYQSPATIEEPIPADPLRGPALGCLVTGGILLAISLFGIFVAQVVYHSERMPEEVRKAAAEESRFFIFRIVLSVLALFVAYSLTRRRNRYSIMLASGLGIILCLPAPLAAIILLRMRRPEVWSTFDRVTDDEDEPRKEA